MEEKINGFAQKSSPRKALLSTWTPIKGFEGLYSINKKGDIRSEPKIKGCFFRKSILLKKKTTQKGYYTVRLWKESAVHDCFVHRLLAMQFIDNPLNKPFINHKDGNKKNNSLSNLEWCTQKENIQHADRMGLRYHGGERCYAHKLTWDIVKIIRKSKKNRFILAKKYNVTPSTIYYIKTNRTWKTDNLKKFKSTAKLRMI